MMYSPGTAGSLHNPKYLRPLFSAKRAKLVIPTLLAAVLVVCLLVFLPGYLDSLSYGDTENVQTHLLIENPEALDQSDQFPKTHEVERGMSLIATHFQTEFRHCVLEELTYDKAFSDQYQEALTERYDQQTHGALVYLITGTLRTGEKDVPAGLEPNTTYENYQWAVSYSSVVDCGTDLI